MDKEQIKSLREAANTGAWLESRIHTAFTEMADMMYGDGYLTRDERKALSGGIGKALEAFTATIEAECPQLYKRGRWQNPEEAAPVLVEESEKGLLAKFTELLRRLTGEKAITEAEVTGDFVPLVERAVHTDGSIPVKIIQPGWGSSGYYSADVLERDGPKVFTKGLKMYFDHPTVTEEAERPERSLRDLAAELTGDARWVADHPAGPGLYAEAQVFDPFRPAIDELAPHIGVSIRASGKAQYGSAEGKSGPIIQEITSAKSVDFVTSPGAGGQILSLFEARREAAHHIQPKESTMSDAELKALQEANAQLEKQLKEQAVQMARFQEAALLREAGEFVAVELTETAKDLSDVTRNRLLRDLAKTPVIKDGRIDEAAYKAQIAEAIKSEREYIATLTEAGKITGMGGNTNPPANDEASRKALVEAFRRAGLSEAEAAIAAAGR